MRSGVIIREDDRVALIERVRDGQTYYVFPGERSRAINPPVGMGSFRITLRVSDHEDTSIAH